MTNVLVLDDDLPVAELVRLVLEDADFRVSVATDISGIPGDGFDCVIADLVGVPSYSFERARDFLIRLRDRLPGTPVIVVTAHADALRDAPRLGVRVLTKPFDLEELIDAVRDASGSAR